MPHPEDTVSKGRHSTPHPTLRVAAPLKEPAPTPLSTPGWRYVSRHRRVRRITPALRSKLCAGQWPGTLSVGSGWEARPRNEAPDGAGDDAGGTLRTLPTTLPSWYREPCGLVPSSPPGENCSNLPKPRNDVVHQSPPTAPSPARSMLTHFPETSRATVPRRPRSPDKTRHGLHRQIGRFSTTQGGNSRRECLVSRFTEKPPLPFVPPRRPVSHRRP